MFIQCVKGLSVKSLRQEHDLILVVIPFRLVVDTSGESIWFGRMPASSVGKGVIKARQIVGPPGLAMVQGLGFSEICAVPVVI